MKKIKRKIEQKFSAFENITEKLVYQIGDAAFLTGHIIYLIMFAILGVTELMLYNCFSVAFYAVLLYVISICKNRNPLILVAMLEVVVHACLGIYFMGWGMGFAMFMLYIVPIPFFMPLKKFWLPYLLSVLDLIIFVFMKLFMINRAGIYCFDGVVINNVVYLINMLFGFIIIIYVSSIYMVNREMMQYRMTAKNESLQKLASVDPLTHLFNRRAMMDFLRIIQSNSRQSGKTYVIGLGDIDSFKHINDTYGHTLGDEVLIEASRIMAACIPAEGYLCRWGGEEFLFAVPSADVSEGVKFADKIRSDLDKKEFSSEKGKFKVTITIGVCEVPPEGDFEKYITVADNRLYKGKANGKNTVISEN